MTKSIVSVKSLKNQAVIADKCVVAERFFIRLLGLMGKKRLLPGEAMFFPRCKDIHMWFMSIPIDVVFVRPTSSPNGKENHFVVTSVRADVRPWKVLPVHDFSARDTFEFAVGTIRENKIQPGDTLCIS